MSAYLAIPSTVQGNPQVGDILPLEILLDNTVGQLTDGWKIKEAGSNAWYTSGSLTLSTASLHPVQADGNHTKLTLNAMVNQPGPLKTADFTLVHGPSGTEVPVAAATLTQSAQPVAQSKTPPPWTLPAIPFGGWNTALILFLAALLAAAVALGLWRLWLRLKPKQKSLNPKEQALQELQDLQKYARAKTALKQEEWKKFSFALAGIIRRYSDTNFQIDSSDMTDREFLAELRRLPKARENVDSLAALLATIDEVRYGKKDLDTTVVPGLLLDSRKFVEQTFLGAEEEKK